MSPERPRRRRLRTKILVGVLSITVIAFATVGFVAASELSRYLIARTDATLQTILTLTRPRLDRILPRAEAGQQLLRLRQNLGDYYLAFVSDSGSTVILQANPELTPNMTAGQALADTAQQARTVANADGRETLRLRALRVDGGVLVAATSLDPIDQTVGQLQLVIIAASLGAVALAAVAIAVVVRRGLLPLEAMATEADRITAGDVIVEVQADEHSEIGRLGAALNGMLVRIREAAQSREADQQLVRQFFADASHELRNPLATLRANAELYRQGALRDPGRLDKAMTHIGLEAERMSRLVDDMLRLARLDQSPEPQRHPVDLTALLTGCVQRGRRADPDRAWHAHIEPDLAVDGDEELLRRAVDNLINNVHVHTPPGSTATLTATRRGRTVTVKVSDDGPGVPPGHLDRVFGRFYRAPTANRQPGSGLGLAIVARTAALHGGTATAAPNEPYGLRITLTLPLTDHSS